MELESELIKKLQQDRKHNRRVFFWLIMIAIGLPVIAVVCAYLYDCAPPEDSDMRPQWTTVPLAENGLAQFEEWLEKHPVITPRTNPETNLKEPTWKAEAARKLIADYQPALDEFDKLAETDIAKWRWKEGAAMANFTASFSYLTEMQTLANLTRQRAKILLTEGKPSEALTLGFKLMSLGQGIQTEGAIIHHLVAITIQAYGQKIIAETIYAFPGYLPGPEVWKKIMVKCEPRPDALVFAFKAEYELSCNLMADIKSGKISGATLSGMVSNPGWERVFMAGVHPNRTQQLYLDVQRPVVRAAEKNWPTLLAASELQMNQLKKMQRNWWALTGMFLRGNPGGEMMIALGLPAFIRVPERYYSTIALHRITFAQFAIREYELANGKLPTTLGDLVPAQLTIVPVDPFDDKPLRWDETKKIIYSVGPDMIDASGDIDEKSAAKGKDVGQKYWWASLITK